jgi:glutathione S-transferase
MLGIPTDPAAVEQAKGMLAAGFDVLERTLSGKDAATEGPRERGAGPRDYLVDAFSLAEVCFMPELESLASMPASADFITSRPSVNAWFERVRARPAWQRILEAKREAAARFAAQRKG